MSSNARGIGNYELSQYAHLNSNGYPMGTDTSPDSVSNGADTGSYIYNKNISLAGFNKSYETVEFKGGGKVWAKHTIGTGSIGNMALSLSGEDDTLQSYWNNSPVDTTTKTNNRGFSPNHGQSEYPNFMSGHHSRYHDENGDTQWRNHFVLNHTVQQPTGAQQSDSGGTNPNPLGFEFVPTRHNRLPWGQLFSANANISVADDRAYEYIIKSNYLYLVHTYIDDGSSTSDAFQLTYKPASTTIGDFYVYNNGVDDSSNVAVAADGQVSLTSANTAGNIMVILYPAQFPLVTN